VSGYRMLGPHEAGSLFSVALLAGALALAAAVWPRAIAYPVAVMLAIAAVTMLARAWKAR
jgi:hypothetical protein